MEIHEFPGKRIKNNWKVILFFITPNPNQQKLSHHPGGGIFLKNIHPFETVNPNRIYIEYSRCAKVHLLLNLLMKSMFIFILIMRVQSLLKEKVSFLKSEQTNRYYKFAYAKILCKSFKLRKTLHRFWNCFEYLEYLERFL